MQPPPREFTSVIHALAWHADQPESRGSTIRYIINKDLETRSIRFEELFLESIGRGQALMPHQGSSIIVLMPDGFEFLQALLSCWLAGVIPVSCPIPQRASQLGRLEQIAKDSGIKKLLIPLSAWQRLLKKIPSFDKDLFEIIYWEDIVSRGQSVAADATVSTERYRSSDHADIPYRLPAGDELALIQYTSGSTGAPKGIMITHANLVANSRMIRDAFGLTRQDRSLSWLPHYHDMGLVEGLLQPIYTGFSSMLMSPQLFLAAPECWFRAIHQFGITYSGGPNFAYDHAIRRVDPANIAAYPATRLRLVYNGAEPIAERTLLAFTEKFGPMGYTLTKMVTCYGLAEATLAVSVSDRGIAPLVLDAAQLRDIVKGHLTEGIRSLVSSGKAVADTIISIRPANDIRPAAGEPIGEGAGQPLAEGVIGEIYVQSPSVSPGYHGDARGTMDTFGQVEDPARSGQRWLRTGDLGFLWQSHLFITGRKKDLIILNGQNIYPQDLEQCASAVAEGRAVAFQLDADAATVVLIAEAARHRMEAEYENMTLDIKQAMFREHGLLPGVLMLVPKGALQVTSSGKISRQSNKEKFKKGEFHQIYKC